jgi:soluble calcium-activated nucleotidase 1
MNVLCHCVWLFAGFDLQSIIPERGYSSVKFVPGSHERLLLALKTEEDSVAGTVDTFITVLGVDGTVHMEDVRVPGRLK